MRSRLACLAVLILLSGCVVNPVPTPATSGSATCAVPSATRADIDITGFPAPGWTGKNQNAYAGWFFGTTKTCTVRWLRVMAGPFDFQIQHSDTAHLPATFDLTSKPATGDCLPADAAPVLTSSGWVVTAGTLHIAELSTDASTTTFELSSSDLVMRMTYNQIDYPITFDITVRVRRFCAALAVGSAFGQGTWAIRAPGLDDTGAPTCSESGGSYWSGHATPTAPPWICNDMGTGTGATAAVSPLYAKDAM